jgi:hypothetical protein
MNIDNFCVMNLSKYINYDTNNMEYITIYYNYYDYCSKRSIKLFAYPNNKLCIPKNTTIEGNKINKDKIQELINEKVLNVKTYESLKIEKSIYSQDVEFEFINNYLLIDKKELYQIIGSIDRDNINFCLDGNLIKMYKRTEMMNQILEALYKKDFPGIYHSILRRNLNSTHLGFLIKEVLFDSKYKLISEAFTLENINEIIEFFNKWTYTDYLRNYYFYDEFLKLKSTNTKLKFLLDKEIIIKKHYYKLKKILSSSNRDKEFINKIFEFITLGENVLCIKEIYDIIEEYDINMIIQDKNKKCIIQ